MPLNRSSLHPAAATMLCGPARFAIGVAFLFACCPSASATDRQMDNDLTWFDAYISYPLEQASDMNQPPSTVADLSTTSSNPQATPIVPYLLGDLTELDAFLDSLSEKQPGMRQSYWTSVNPSTAALNHQTTVTYPDILGNLASQDPFLGYVSMQQPGLDQSHSANTVPSFPALSTQTTAMDLYSLGGSQGPQPACDRGTHDQPNNFNVIIHNDEGSAGDHGSASTPPVLLPIPKGTGNGSPYFESANGKGRTTDLKRSVRFKCLRHAIEAELNQLPESERPKDYYIGGNLKVKKLHTKYHRSKGRIDPDKLPIELAAYWIRYSISSRTSNFIKSYVRPHLANYVAITYADSQVAPPNLDSIIARFSEVFDKNEFAFGLYWDDFSEELCSYIPDKSQSRLLIKVPIQKILNKPHNFFTVYSIPITHFHTLAAEILKYMLAKRKLKSTIRITGSSK